MRLLARRVLGAVGLAVLIALSVVSPASAKGTPYFTVEITPPQPVAGQAVVVAVRTWDDVAHTIPAKLDSAATLQGLLVLRSAAGDSPDVAISLQYEAPDTFRATIVVPSAGDWKLVAFPERTGWATADVPPGYPDSIALTVRAPSDGVSTNAAMAGLAALVLIVWAAVLLAARARRARRISAVHST